MAAKSLPKSVVDDILADWRTGEYSQRALAEKHQASNGAVAKITKGINQDTKSIVSKGIEYQQGLQSHDERNVSAITAIVDAHARDSQFFNDAALLVAGKALSMASMTDSAADLRHVSAVIKDQKEVRFGKQVDTQVNIQNNNAVSSVNTMTPAQFAEACAKALTEI